MSAKTDPILSLSYGWTLGESGWNTGMDANLLTIATLLQLSVADKDLAAPPDTPAAGDRYIVAADATGDWDGQDGNVAVYVDSAWTFYEPNAGWIAHVEDEPGALYRYDGSDWIALAAGPARLSKALSDADVTLTAAESAAQILEFSGTLTAARTATVKLDARQWTVANLTDGGFGITIAGATGTGITIANGKRAIVYADGTNVVRVTADQ